MTRKDFFERVGFGAAALLVPACVGGLAASCEKEDDGKVSPAPTHVNFTLDISTGALAVNGGYLTTQGIVVARTNSGDFLAVSASCTHQGTNVKYRSASNDFHCPNHGANFSSTGAVTQGPATRNLTSYQTELTGNTLRIYS